MEAKEIRKELQDVSGDKNILDVLVKHLDKEIVEIIEERRIGNVKETNWEFVNLLIYEDGEKRKIIFEELIEFQKQGYLIDIKLIKPEVVKKIAIEFKKIKEE